MNSSTFNSAFKSIVGASSAFSLCGSLTIVVVYVAFRDLRTVTRFILANMSVADAMLNGSHLFGLFAILGGNEDMMSVSDTWRTACCIQGAFALFSTVGYFLWTVALAFHFIELLAVKDAGIARALLMTSCVLCWGIPLALTVVYGSRGYFGYEFAASPGWCYASVASNDTGGGGEPLRLAVQILAYDAWLYLVIFVVPCLYCAIRCYIRIQFSHVGRPLYVKMQSLARNTDLKLMAVGVVFIMLKAWPLVINIEVFYFHQSTLAQEIFASTSYGRTLQLLSGIASSTQGLANGLMFCIFTPVIRRRLLSNAVGCCKHHHEETVALVSSTTIDGNHSGQPDYKTQRNLITTLWNGRVDTLTYPEMQVTPT